MRFVLGLVALACTEPAPARVVPEPLAAVDEPARVEREAPEAEPDDGSIEVLCAPNDFHTVKAALEKAGLKPEVAEVTMKPLNDTALAGGDAQRMRSLLDALEGLDDVQDVYTTAVLEDA